MSHQYAGCAAGAPVLTVPAYRREGLWAPDNVEAFSVFVPGYPTEDRKQQDRFDESRIHFVK